jgi:RND superfamily putative drug exporter
VSFLLLMMVFRSIAVPLKAAAMTCCPSAPPMESWSRCSSGAGGPSSLGLEGPTPITSLIVVIMFPILFGLSMDYEVFLLSRIKEEYDATGDNTESVAAASPAPAGSSPPQHSSWSRCSSASSPARCRR